MTRRAKKGLTLIAGKRCSCSKAAQPTCEHSWFFQKGFGRTPEGKPKQYRFAIDERAGKHIASKADAEELAFTYWQQIKKGTFETAAEPVDPLLTLSRLFELHFEDVQRSDNDESMRGIILRTALPALDGVTRPLADWQVAPMMTITPDDVEAYRKLRQPAIVERATRKRDQARARLEAEIQTLRAADPTSSRLSSLEQALADVNHRVIPTGKTAPNHELRLWKAILNWGLRKKKITSTPFKVRHDDGVVSAVEIPSNRARRRRFEDDEEARLLAACSESNPKKGGTDLRAIIETALDTCCRPGELLSLQWCQVNFDRNEIYLPAEKTKSGKLSADENRGDRWIPMTQRVRARLEMRRLDSDGEERKSTDYVFGREDGSQITSIKTAWTAARRRAGIRGLQLRDLRREGASSLLESRMSDRDVQEILGHANIRTTSTYLATTRQRLQDSMRRAESVRATTDRYAHADAHGGAERKSADSDSQNL